MRSRNFPHFAYTENVYLLSPERYISADAATGGVEGSFIERICHRSKILSTRQETVLSYFVRRKPPEKP